MSKIKHGGFRLGAGRKAGTGRYGEPTRVMRVPVSKVINIERYINRQQLQNADTFFTVRIEGKQHLPLVG